VFYVTRLSTVLELFLAAKQPHLASVKNWHMLVVMRILIGIIIGSLSFTFQAQAKPVTVAVRSLGGVRAQVATIDLGDAQTHLDIVLANNAPRANSSQEQFGDELFGSMVNRAKAALVVNGTFFSKDAQKRVMGNMVRSGIFVKYSRWENFGTTFGLNQHNQPDMFTLRAGDTPRWEKHWFSLTCGPRLLKDGQVWLSPKTEGFSDPHVLNSASRSALGYSQDSKTLWLVTFLSPLSLAQEAAAMKALGAYQAMNLDGGASKGLAFKGQTLMAPGRKITNAIAVYDSVSPASQALKQSRTTFTLARLPNGDLPILSPDQKVAMNPTPKPVVTPAPSPTLSAPVVPLPSSSTPQPVITPVPTAAPRLWRGEDVQHHPEAQQVLAAPKYFFWYLYRKDYPKAWQALTETSRQSIVREIVATLESSQTEAQVRQAMDSYDPDFAPTFWEAFRHTIDSEKWVKHNFVLSEIQGDSGQVLTQPSNIQLQIKKEKGHWRFGFSETFS
jgi:hypothetical protein